MRALLYCAGGGIGDSLIASVVARALRARYGTVDALTLPAHRRALERVPDLDDVLVDDGGEEQALAAKLRERSYDCAVVTWATPRTARVPELARIPLRVGQARRLYSHRFTKRVVVRSENGDVTSHWSDVLLDYARAIDCDTAERTPRFVPTSDDRREAQVLLDTLGVREHLILHPTNAIASTRGIWPARGWASLARALAHRFEIPILLSGTDADRPINDEIVREAADPRVASVAGTIGIGAFGALAEGARAFVGRYERALSGLRMHRAS
jgi:heptosyltransferase-2